MDNFSNQKVSNFMIDLQSINPGRYEMALEVRNLYFKHDANISEDIKYGGLVFLREKTLVGGIFFYKEHVSIEFSEGASLADPSSVLEGKGKLRRHIKIKSYDDIQAKNVGSYIKAVLANQNAHV